jgi:thiol-disulfide isomerase/thioredoxin
MKKLPILLFCAASLSAHAQESYTIRGELTNAPEGCVAILGSGTGVFIEDTVEVRGGRFAFDGHIDYPQEVSLTIGMREWPADSMRRLFIFLSNDDIAVAGDYRGEIAITGSPFDGRYHEMERRLFEAFDNGGSRAVDNYLLDAFGERLDDVVELAFIQLLSKERFADIQRLAVSIPAELRSHPYAKEFLAAAENHDKLTAPKIAVGERYLPVSLPDADGNIVDTEPLLQANDHLLLDFWASWCGACVADIPRLKQLYESCNAAWAGSLAVYSISLDTLRESWLAGMERVQFPWPAVSSLEGFTDRYAMRYIAMGIPCYVLVGADGTVLYSGNYLHRVIELLDK